ncbi:hypothetical protein BB559_000291 [Furculomyces boomerangus]|uniref:RhoGAP-domain-containing protein n=2 Tax=Harpellales TaxID=61421 RepID=A0A2T9Z5M5_9FUNG|nr:hypothetical protein BB559_000291 [Furculomyces boomerangus]PWA02024.1 hypothetical protein BB558_001841 [Smittium angustum]
MNVPKKPSSEALPIDPSEFPTCWGCSKLIEDGKAIQFSEGVWHLECFKCTTCSKLINLDSSILFLADGKPICSECSYSCSLCSKPIYDEAIVTAEGTYHSECFRCSHCSKRIQGKSFAKTNSGVIYCVPCYNDRKERKRAAQKRNQERRIQKNKDLPRIPPASNIEQTFDQPHFDKDNDYPLEDHFTNIPISSNPKISQKNKTSTKNSFDSAVLVTQEKIDLPANPPEKTNFPASPPEKRNNKVDSPNINKDEKSLDEKPLISPSLSENLFDTNRLLLPEIQEIIKNKIDSIPTLDIKDLSAELLWSYKHILVLETFISKLKEKDTSPNDFELSKELENESISDTHLFAAFSTLRPVRCDKCSDLIWGINAKELRCKVCGYTCHYRCLSGAPKFCAMPNLSKKDQTVLPFSNGTATNNTTPENTLIIADTNKDGVDTTTPDSDSLNKNNSIDLMFKRSLEAQVAFENSKDNIPWIVKSSIQFIEENGLLMEGIYRKSGSTSDIKTAHSNIIKIAKQKNIGRISPIPPIASADMDVCCISSILKQYFRDLNDPLLTFKYYSNWVKLFSNSSESESTKISMCRELGKCLPSSHINTLKYLLRHLKKVSENSNKNLMSVANLAVVFAPNLLRLPDTQLNQEMMQMSAINMCITFLINKVNLIWPPQESDSLEKQNGLDSERENREKTNRIELESNVANYKDVRNGAEHSKDIVINKDTNDSNFWEGASSPHTDISETESRTEDEIRSSSSNPANRTKEKRLQNDHMAKKKRGS